jgi:hypothetical protein
MCRKRALTPLCRLEISEGPAGTLNVKGDVFRTNTIVMGEEHVQKLPNGEEAKVGLAAVVEEITLNVKHKLPFWSCKTCVVNTRR